MASSSGADRTGAAQGDDAGSAGVPVQGAEVAVRCAVRTELDHASHLVARRREVSPLVRLRADAGRAFLADVTAVMSRSRRVAVVAVSDEEPHRAQAATAEALAGEADVVVAPWLPDDPRGHRSSRPDLVVRSGSGWVPVVVRHHRITRPQEDGSSMRCSPLDDPRPGRADLVAGLQIRPGPYGDDALRLAHHRRALEAAGLSPVDDPPAGGLVDKDRVVWWLPLDEPRWPVPWADEPVTALERYDHEFRRRIDAVANRLQRNDDPEVARLLAPVRIGECDQCPWEEVCAEELEAVDHVSLVPGFRERFLAEHERRGTTTRADLADLDWRTAAAIFGLRSGDEPLDLAALQADVAALPPGRELGEVLGDHPARPRLHGLGLDTVDDLAGLDDRTATYSGAAVGHLPSAIDQARAQVAGRVFRTRGLDQLHVTRAAVEVDVDMENVEAGVYLWGTLTTLRSPEVERLGIGPGYRPFVSWEAVDDGLAATVFADFWAWLGDVRRRATEVGLTFAAYCYTSAEFDKMRQIVAASPGHPGLPDLQDVVTFVESPAWVDLYDTVRTSIVTGGRLGLKKVAPLAGFSWRDEDPGGEQSMYWHELAVHAPDAGVRAEHRRRLLAYNEDDVRATLAVRTWLAESTFPPVEDWRRHRGGAAGSGVPGPPGGGRSDRGRTP